MFIGAFTLMVEH